MSGIERETGTPRDEIRDLLPDWVAGRLASDAAERVERAVRRDPGLEREAEMLGLLHRGRPRAPEGLEARIVDAVRAASDAGAADAGPARGLPAGAVWRWGLAAAAVLALALGTLDPREREPAAEPSGAGGALDRLVYEEAGSPWSDDGVIAGAPVLDGLSEDALTTLLEELEG